MSETVKPLILSVDDDHDILKLVERFLTSSGYDVRTADSADKALQMLDKITPDLILLDVIMPETNGYEFCANLQKNKKFAFIPVVFLTALEEEQHKAWAFAAGGVDYLTKPTDKDKLIGVVKKHLKTKKQWSELEKATQKPYPNFKRFKEFLIKHLNLSPEKRDKIMDIGIPQLYSISAGIGFTNSNVAMLIAEFLGVAYIPFIDPDDVQLGVLPTPFCVQNYVLAISGDSGKHIFALTNPFDTELLNILKGYSGADNEFNFSITEPDNIELLLKCNSTTPIKPLKTDEDRVQIVKSGNEEKEDKQKLKEPSEWEIERHPVVYLANNIIYRATTERASDIHIEPKEGDTVVRFRIDGDMREIFTLQKKTAVMLISRYKILGGMDISEKRKPQDGAFEAMIGNKSFKLRLATTSTPYGESIIIRVLEPTAKPKDLRELGMTEKQVNTIISFANRHQGFILIVGATGSGKTTTIYSVLFNIDCSKRSLISVEDPVEYKIPLANQQQVNEKAGVTFESLLKSSVRQDPDILYMGEMRDSESAKTAIDFASTGHLVISTMHSSNATSAVFRLERLGISRWMMADSIIGVVSQRLIKKLCPHCKKEVEISREETDMLSPFTDEIPSKVAHPSGCPQCYGTGYLGREAVYEIMEFNQETSEIIRSNRPIQEMRSFIKSRGGYLMSDHAVEKVKKLIFSPKDVYEKVLVEDMEFGVREPVKEDQKASSPDDKRISDKISILIAEDDKDTQILISRLLENQGYEVTVAGDGIEAILCLGKKEFNLILSDIDMPNLDGLKLLEMKNQKGIKTPVVFLTARTGDESELQGLELGATDYIKKPIQKEVLLSRIKKALK
ncbi:MAG: Flp pilus assembly complex ATPase component TadA [Planctomycetes bacterium]|nr:Flp pilus assembly complex ATPase component TadA [Planctomycetota bacterium]